MMHSEVYLALRADEGIYRGIGALFSALPKDSFVLPDRDDLKESKRLDGPHISVAAAEYQMGSPAEFKRQMLEIAGKITPRYCIELRPIIGKEKNELLLVPRHSRVKVLRAFRDCVIQTLGLDLSPQYDPHLSLGGINPNFKHASLMKVIGSMWIDFNVVNIYTSYRTYGYKHHRLRRRVITDSFRPRLQQNHLISIPYSMQSPMHTP